MTDNDQLLGNTPVLMNISKHMDTQLQTLSRLPL